MAKQKKTIVNPFDVGVSYDTFLKALGTASIETYLKEICSTEQIEWLIIEVEQLKKQKNGN